MSPKTGGYINNTGLKQEYSRRNPVVMMDHDKPLDFAIACLSANPCYMTSRFPSKIRQQLRHIRHPRLVPELFNLEHILTSWKMKTHQKAMRNRNILFGIPIWETRHFKSYSASCLSAPAGVQKVCHAAGSSVLAVRVDLDQKGPLVSPWKRSLGWSVLDTINIRSKKSSGMTLKLVYARNWVITIYESNLNLYQL